MKKSLVLAMALAMGVTASAYAANPFSDVPAGHWAYDSIQQLADAGVIEGYGDTTFGGDRLMTRYEMAQIVAKAMARGANVDKLAAEFADELDTLGVRVANLEKKADNVKITGEARYRYWSYDKKNVPGHSDNSTHVLRSRIWITGQVNDTWKYTGMLENIQTFDNDDGDEETKFQRAYVDGRLGGVMVRAGRYQYNDGYSGGMIYDSRMDGVQVSYGKDVKLVVGAGKAADGNGSHKAEDMYYAKLTGKMGVFDASVGYNKFEDYAKIDDDTELWSINVGYKIIDDLKLQATYLMSDYDENDVDDDGFLVELKYKGAKASQPGSWGITADYYDMSLGTYVAPTFEADYSDLTTLETEGFKGYSITAECAVAKNMVAKVTWFDLEAKEGEREADTLYAHLNITF